MCYLQEGVGVELDAVLVPGDVGQRVPRGGAHEHDLAPQDVLGLEVRPPRDLRRLNQTNNNHNIALQGTNDILC